MKKIMPIGDSMTRGSYLAVYESGPFAGQAIGLPHPAGGGWRKPLQDLLWVAGIDFEFVGELDYGAYGHDGVVDPDFKPCHHGLAGFGNQGILDGGVVPTPRDVLTACGLSEIRVPDIVTALKHHQPDIVLLMSGANGFDAAARDRLMHTILAHMSGHLLVATIPPQCPPRWGWEQVDAYNASLPDAVSQLNEGDELHAASVPAQPRITLVDMNVALTTADLTSDGVHPNSTGMNKIADAWYSFLLDSC